MHYPSIQSFWTVFKKPNIRTAFRRINSYENDKSYDKVANFIFGFSFTMLCAQSYIIKKGISGKVIIDRVQYEKFLKSANDMNNELIDLKDNKVIIDKSKFEILINGIQNNDVKINNIKYENGICDVEVSKSNVKYIEHFVDLLTILIFFR